MLLRLCGEVTERIERLAGLSGQNGVSAEAWEPGSERFAAAESAASRAGSISQLPAPLHQGSSGWRRELGWRLRGRIARVLNC